MKGRKNIFKDENNNLWNFELPDGRSISMAIKFMYPYVRDKSKWFLPPDVMYDEEWPVRQSFYVLGGKALKRPALIELWKTLDPIPPVEEIIRNCPIRQPVLWLD